MAADRRGRGLKLKTAGTSNQWVDAYERYGVTLDETGLSRLMTPAPNKQPVENKSELEDGKRIVSGTKPKKGERNIALLMNLTASSEASFFERYALFCSEILDYGYIRMKTGYQSGVVYKMTYVDCTQFSEFRRGMAKFTLSLNEPNPNDRSE